MVGASDQVSGDSNIRTHQMNGVAGHQMQQQPTALAKVGPKKLINQHEYLRLIEQALYKLGYDTVARQLEQESGIQMQPHYATQFQQRLLAGDWEGTLNLLPTLTADEEVSKDVRFLVLQQKYLEALEAGDSEGALTCLRTELAPLGVHQLQLHCLAGLLLCPGTPDLAQRAGWLGGGKGHRGHVMSRIQEALQAPGVMLPDARLEVLLEQALTAQVNRCPFHNGMPETSLSLLTDYQAGAESLPSKCVQVLDAHSDEVWHVVFSHSGTMLASASKDKTVILWSVRPHTPSSSRPASHPSHTPSFRASPSSMTPPSSSIPSTSHPAIPPFPLQPSSHGFTTTSTFTHAPIPPPALPASAVSTGPTPLWTLRHPQSAQQQQQQQQQRRRQLSSSSDVLVPVLQAEGVLRGHDQPVAFVTWSPDDQLLLTVSDEVVRLWQVSTGRLLHTFTHHREAVSCCAWMPDSKSFLSGSVDKTIIMSDVKGHELQRWKRPYRVQDMAVTHNGALLIVACSDKQIHILRLSDGREVTLQEEVPITSISLSPDSTFLLTALQSHVLRLWHLGELAVSCATQALGKLQDRSTEDPMDTMVPSSSVAEYHVSGSLLGQPGRYVLRSAFGGAHSSFVVHGSEDCLVYLWHRDSSELLLQLEGHSATVNACSWNPTNPHLLVSASDDRTIRVWMSEASLSSSGHR